MNTVNLLHARFGHGCGHPLGGVNTKDALQKLQKPMRKYKVLKRIVYNIC